MSSKKSSSQRGKNCSNIIGKPKENISIMSLSESGIDEKKFRNPQNIKLESCKHEDHLLVE